MSDFPFTLAAFLVMLGVLIVVHELGHYLAARWCGVKVLRFSVGFGRSLWQRKFGPDRTEWAVGVFPLGGYVRMLDEREAPVAPEELHRAFNRQPVGKRSLIVAAGPLANFLLAIVLYWGLFMAGGEELLPILGRPLDGTPAAMAGVRNGEEVRRIDGEEVATWSDFRWRILQKAADQESVQLEVVNEQREVSWRRIPLNVVAEQGWEGDALDRLGLVFYRPKIPPVIGKLTPGSPAERSGLHPGDRILALDGVVVESWPDVVMAIRQSAERTLVFRVQRSATVVELSVTPDRVQERGKSLGRIGAAVADPGPGLREVRTFVRYGPGESALRALRETWDKAVFSVVMFGKMLTGEVSWRNLSGPVTIADYAGQSAKLGLDYYLRFMALVSISLGVLNLLPIPVLDGGHLMYHIAEVIKRGPLSERAMEVGQQVGLSILLVLMAFAFFNDITRLFAG